LNLNSAFEDAENSHSPFVVSSASKEVSHFEKIFNFESTDNSGLDDSNPTRNGHDDDDAEVEEDEDDDDDGELHTEHKEEEEEIETHDLHNVEEVETEFKPKNLLFSFSK